jgi:hypothetical protein
MICFEKQKGEIKLSPHQSSQMGSRDGRKDKSLSSEKDRVRES